MMSFRTINILVTSAILYSVCRNAQAASTDKSYCSKIEIDTLEERVSNSDVIITGTVIELVPGPATEGRVAVTSGDGNSVIESRRKSSSHAVALVKIWRVVKGSLENVKNQTSAPGDLLSDHASIPTYGSKAKNPVVQLHGLWNKQVCGSDLTGGNTRIFFLKKFRDARDIPEMIVQNSTRAVPSSKVSMTADKLTDTGESETSMRIPKDKVKSGEKKKGKRSKKKKDGKKSRKKTKKTSKSTKKKKKRLSSKSKSSKEKRRKRTSESLGYELEKYYRVGREKRRKRSNDHLSRMKRQQIETHYPDVETSDPRSVLVVAASPARITLMNLDRVETLSNAKR